MRLWLCFVAFIVLVVTLAAPIRARAQCENGVCVPPAATYAAPSFTPRYYAPLEYYAARYYAEPVYLEVPTYHPFVGVVEIRECAPAMRAPAFQPQYATSGYAFQGAAGFNYSPPAVRGRYAVRQRIR